MIKPQCFHFEPSDWVPNHATLPVLFYAKAFASNDRNRLAERFEHAFANAGWKGVWRNGVFPYHHYHSGAHEVLGIAGGEARLLIGGPHGATIRVSAGDCVVLPAGTGHRNLGSSDGFLVIGAYPQGQYADILTEAATSGQMQTISSLPLPRTDPLYGENGPLRQKWRS